MIIHIIITSILFIIIVIVPIMIDMITLLLLLLGTITVWMRRLAPLLQARYSCGLDADTKGWMQVPCGAEGSAGNGASH
jgi:hypothetical protein